MGRPDCGQMPVVLPVRLPSGQLWVVPELKEPFGFGGALEEDGYVSESKEGVVGGEGHSRQGAALRRLENDFRRARCQVQRLHLSFCSAEQDVFAALIEANGEAV